MNSLGREGRNYFSIALNTGGTRHARPSASCTCTSSAPLHGSGVRNRQQRCKIKNIKKKKRERKEKEKAKRSFTQVSTLLHGPLLRTHAHIHNAMRVSSSIYSGLKFPRCDLRFPIPIRPSKDEKRRRGLPISAPPNLNLKTGICRS